MSSRRVSFPHIAFLSGVLRLRERGRPSHLGSFGCGAPSPSVCTLRDSLPFLHTALTGPSSASRLAFGADSHYGSSYSPPAPRLARLQRLLMILRCHRTLLAISFHLRARPWSKLERARGPPSTPQLIMCARPRGLVALFLPSQPQIVYRAPPISRATPRVGSRARGVARHLRAHLSQ